MKGGKEDFFLFQEMYGCKQTPITINKFHNIMEKLGGKNERKTVKTH
jgi:hypothetical protein